MNQKIIGIFVCIMFFTIGFIQVTGTLDKGDYETESNHLPWFRLGRVWGEYDTKLFRDHFLRDIAIESEGGNIHFYGYAKKIWEYYEIDNATFLYTPYFLGYCFNGKINGYCISFGDRAIDVGV